MVALSAMGTAPEKPIFPAVVNCPLCHAAALYLFDDTGTDGLWLNCSACDLHGDILTCSAQIWNTSLTGAIDQFSELGLITKNDGEKHAGEHIRAFNRRNDAEAFWAETSEQLWNHGDDIIACRLRELGVDRDTGAGNGLIGVAHPDQIAKLCGDVGRPVPPRLRDTGPSLVFPFYDLPQRLTGFLLIQYNDSFQSRRNFIALAGVKKRKPDAGYYLLQTALTPAVDPFREMFFVVDDPLWALQAQTTQLKFGGKLLPLASAYHGADATSYGNNWTAISNTARFFHGLVYSPELISQAAAGRGYVCVTAFKTPDAPPTVHRNVMRLAEIRRNAQTWQQALDAVLLKNHELAAQTFATKLTIAHEKLQRYFSVREQQFSKSFANQVLLNISAATAAPTKVHRRWVVIERENSWWTHTGTQVCNARVQITKVIQADTGEKLYSGTIDTAAGRYEFTDSAQKIERAGLLAYAAQYVAAHGVLIMFDRAWNTRAHLIAMTLHEPELVRVSGRLGWDNGTNKFYFYNYALTNSGEIVAADFPAVRPDKQGNFPFANEAAPLTLQPLLTVSADNAFIWNIFSCFAAGLIAPIVGQAPPIVGLPPAAFEAAVQIGAALDCRHERAQARAYRHVMDLVVKSTATTEWPVFISHTINDMYCSHAVPRCMAGPGFVRLLPHCALVAPSYGWFSVFSHPPKTMPDLLALRHVFAAYLQSVLVRRSTFFAPAQNILTAIQTDLGRWLTETYGNTFNAAAIQAKTYAPENAHEAVLRGISAGIADGKLDVLPRPRQKNQPKNYILRNKQHWWLPQCAIDSYFYSAGKLAPNWTTVLELLEQRQLLCGEETVHNTHGFLIRRDWCDNFWNNTEPTRAQDIG